MTAIMTGTCGIATFRGRAIAPKTSHMFGAKRIFDKENQYGFARLSAFSDNANHAPSGMCGAVTSDAGMELLFRIAGRG